MFTAARVRWFLEPVAKPLGTVPLAVAVLKLVPAVFLAAALISGGIRQANADPAGKQSSPAKSAVANSSTTVDVFDAMHDGDLGVQFIPRSSREATLILTNNTDEPLNVHLPDAFAAVPALAQFPNFNNQPNNRLPATNNNNVNNTSNKNPNQTLGGGTPQNTRQTGFGPQNGRQGAQQNGAQFGNLPGAAFDIQPERVVKIKLPVVCLEYGKQEPTAHVPYTIEPIASYTKSPEVQEICRQLGTGKVDQRAAQAAAWHLANHMSWEKLTDMKTWPHNHGFSRPTFTADQIKAAKDLTEKAIKAVEARDASPDGSAKQSDSAQTTSSHDAAIAESR